MSLDVTSNHTVRVPGPEKRGRLGFRLGVVVVAVAATVGAAKAWDSGYRPARFWEGRPISLSTLDVDRGELEVFVRETGSLESASNTTVRCQVEALVGLVGGAASAKGQGASAGGGQGGQNGQGGGGGGGQASAPSAPSGGGGEFVRCFLEERGGRIVEVRVEIYRRLLQEEIFFLVWRGVTVGVERAAAEVVEVEVEGVEVEGVAEAG